MRDKPNILLILTDQHRLSAVGCYDSESPCRTPHIDALAQDGVLFKNAFTPCPVCSPARASILTGQYPHRHGILTNVHEINTACQGINESPHLLSRKLQNAGYRVGYTGKWHLGDRMDKHSSIPEFPVSPALPETFGFEGQNFGGHGGGGFNYPEFKSYLEERGFRYGCRPHCKMDWPDNHERGILEGPVDSSVSYYLTEHSIGLMDQFSENPWFIWHNFWGPHEPYYVSAEFYEMYKDVEIPPWPDFDWPAEEISGPHHMMLSGSKYRKDWSYWQESLRYYYAFASMIDDQIGRMVKELKDRGEYDNTMIIFSADHGESLGSHGGIYNKGWTHFDETHHIPFVIKYPDGQAAGGCSDSLVSLCDIYPTVLDTAGERESAQYSDSYSLSLSSKGVPGTKRDCIVTEFAGVEDTGTTMRTLRRGRMVYGYNAAADDELYDLENDPFQMTNLIRDPAYVNECRDMRLRLYRWMQDCSDPAIQAFYRSRMA